MNENLKDTPDAPGAATYPTNKQRAVLWTALTALAVVSLLGVAALIFLGFISFLSWSYPILLPIGLAVIVALVLEPAVNFVQKRGLSRGNATLMVCLLTVVGFLLFWAFLLPPIVSQAGGFFKSLPTTMNDGLTKFTATLAGDDDHHTDQWSAYSQNAKPTPAVPTLLLNQPTANSSDTNAPQVVPPSADEKADSEPGKKSSELLIWLKANLPAIQQSVEKNIANWIYSALGPVGQAFGFVLGFGFVPIYVYYFLADQEHISNHWHDYVPLRRSALRDEVISVLGEINTSLVSYFRGQIIVAACNGVLTFVGLSLIGIPYSLVLGIITGVLSIVPFLGIIASIIPALLLGFLSAQAGSTWQWLTPVLVIVVFALVQMSESMFITPRVQSHSTGLHPLIIIIGILFWSLLLPGLLGPVVAVPLTCAVVVLLRRYVWQEKKTE